jgi:PAS domain S-box-containing protein
MRQLGGLIDEMKVEEQSLDGRREREQRLRFELLTALLVIGAIASAASGAVLIVRHRDALRRDRYHAERERLLDRLEQSLSTVDALIGNSPVGISLFDRDLRFVRLNEVVARTTGLPISAHIGRRISELLPQTRGVTERKLAHVLATGQPIVDGEIVAEAPRQAGDVRVWQVSVFPVRGREGTVSGVGMLSRDVTERERAQRERAEMLRFAEQFVAILGHDLRTPLGAIQMAALALKGKLPRDEALDGDGGARHTMGAGRCVEIVLSSVRRMNELTTQLLDLTRARLAGGIPIERRSGNISAVVAATIDEVRAAFPERSIRSVIAPDVVVAMDLNRIAQVISNLTVNAISHGDPAAPVEVRLRLEGDVVLEVHNRGAPIPETDQLHIFDPYRRGERRGTASGLGLGLYITRQIVLAHGGEISVSSTSTEGTTFLVRLPCEAAGLGEAAGAPPPKTALEGNPVA